MRLFDYGRLSPMMDEEGMDVIVTNSVYNNMHFTDFDFSQFSRSHKTADYLMWHPEANYSLFVGLPKEEAKGAFMIAPAYLKTALDRGGLWIEERRMWGPGFYPLDKWGEDVAVGDPIDHAAKTLAEKGFGRGRVGLEMSHISGRDLDRFRALMPEAIFVDAGPLIWRLRSMKTAEEIRRVRVACENTCRCMEAAFTVVREGTPLKELIGAVRKGFVDVDLKDEFLLVFAGTQFSGTPTANTGASIVKRGQFVRFDIGGSYLGYTADVSRVIAVGEIDAEARRAHETCQRVSEAMIAACRPGVKCNELRMIEARMLKEAGYKQAINLSGHSFGHLAHEPPYFTETDDTPLQAGMTLSVEPTVRHYYPDGSWININIEDNILITAEGAEVLTKTSRGLYPR